MQDCIQRLALDARDVTPRVVVERCDEVLHQERKILGAFAQRRYRDYRCLQPVIQILAQMTAGYRCLRITVGRSDQPDIDRYFLSGADRADYALLDRAEQLALGLGAHFGDFIEKQGSTLGGAEQAGVFGKWRR